TRSMINAKPRTEVATSSHIGQPAAWMISSNVVSVRVWLGRTLHFTIDSTLWAVLSERMSVLGFLGSKQPESSVAARIAKGAPSKHMCSVKNIGQMACNGALKRVSTKSVDNSVDKLADSRYLM